MTRKNRMFLLCLVATMTISMAAFAASPTKGAFDSSKYLKDYAGQTVIGCKNAWRGGESLILGEYV